MDAFSVLGKDTKEVLDELQRTGVRHSKRSEAGEVIYIMVESDSVDLACRFGVVSSVFFSPASNEASLPFGLRFDMTRAEVRRCVPGQLSSDPQRSVRLLGLMPSRDTFKVSDEHRLLVEYHSEDGRVIRIVVDMGAPQ